MQLQGFRGIRRSFKQWAGHLRATNWFTFEHPGLPQALGANCARRTGRRQIVEVSPVEWWGLGVAEGSPLGDPASQTTAKGSPQSRSAACPPRRQPITRQSQRLVGHGEDRGLFDGVPGRCVPMRSNRVWSRSNASGSPHGGAQVSSASSCGGGHTLGLRTVPAQQDGHPLNSGVGRAK